MSYIMILDTETSGLPPALSNAYKDRWKYKPVTDSKAWECARLVQIAWNLYAKNGTVIKKRDFVIYPDGFKIPKEASNIHGFTMEIALKKGIPLREAMEVLAEDLLDTSLIVCHNMAFDDKIVVSELIRAKYVWIHSMWVSKQKHCTMLTNTIPGQRWPKLCNLYERLYGHQPIAELHRADEDIRITAEVFFKLYPDGKVFEYFVEK